MGHCRQSTLPYVCTYLPLSAKTFYFKSYICFFGIITLVILEDFLAFCTNDFLAYYTFFDQFSNIKGITLGALQVI